MSEEEKPANRDLFIEAYKKKLLENYPNLSDETVNDCVHGCLIAVNSELGLSSESFAAAEALGIEPTEKAIIEYVFTKD